LALLVGIGLKADAASYYESRIRSSASTPRSLGLLGLVILTLGVLVAPLSHSVGHRNDHSHGEQRGPILGPDALREHEDADEVSGHGHDNDHDHDHDHDSSRKEGSPAGGEHHDEGPRPAPDPHHGEGSLEHFRAAVLLPALFIVPIAFVRLEALGSISLESVRVTRRLLGPNQPRAPPT